MLFSLDFGVDTIAFEALVGLIQQGIQHHGFSLINTISPCVTYNKVNTYDWYKKVLFNLDDLPDYDPRDKVKALGMLHEREELVTGLIYYEESTAEFAHQLPGYREEALVHQDLTPDPDELLKLMEAYR